MAEQIHENTDYGSPRQGLPDLRLVTDAERIFDETIEQEKYRSLRIREERANYIASTIVAGVGIVVMEAEINDWKTQVVTGLLSSVGVGATLRKWWRDTVAEINQ